MISWNLATPLTTNGAFNIAAQSSIDGGGSTAYPLLSGLTAWYDASNSAYLTIPAGIEISQYLDRSGNGNNTVVQSNSAKRPAQTADQLNNLPTSTYDNTDTLALQGASLFAIPNGNNTGFFVAKRSTEAGIDDRIFGITEGGSGRYLLTFASASGSIFFQSRTAVGSAVTFTGANNTEYQIITTKRNGTEQYINVNGGTAATNASGASEAGCDGGWIGSINDSSNYLDGGIAEILIYNRALSAIEISQVEIYLANKWGIYHPNAAWINAYPQMTQDAIHVGKYNKDYIDSLQPNVFVLMGASNTVGYDESFIANGFPYLQGTIPGVNIWNYTGTGSSGTWEILEAGVNNKSFDATTFGPEMNLAHFITGRNGETQYIIKSALAGSALNPDVSAPSSWSPAVSNQQYDRARARITGACQALADVGIVPILAGYFIHLGGNDRTAEFYLSVETNMTALLQALAADDISDGIQGTPTRYVCGLVDYTSPGIYAASVQAQLDAAVAANPNCESVSLAGIAVGTDGTHYNYNGQTDFGEVMAEQIVTITMPYTAGRVLNLDASDAAQITKDGSDLVSSWDDGTVDFTASLTERPTWVDNVLNGEPIVRFNGSANFMNAGQPAGLLFVPQTNAFSFVAVGINAVNTANTIISKAQSTAAGRQYAMTIVAAGLQGRIGGTQIDFLDTDPVTGTPYMLTLTTNTVANSIRGYLGATQSANGLTADPGSATDTADVLLGARRATDVNTGSTSYFNGDIAQILAYNGQLTARMVGKLYTYMDNKWGL